MLSRPQVGLCLKACGEQIDVLKDGVPQAMELKDSFGQTSVLKFTNFQRNPQLGAQQFKFEVPKGAEVVSQ